MANRAANLEGRPMGQESPLGSRNLIAATCLLAAALHVTTFGGCASGPPPPPASASNLRLNEEEEQTRRTLTAAERGELLEAMRSVAAGAEVVDAPGPAPLGVRWSDVPHAASGAAGAVDMWVVKAERIDGDPNRLRFELRTIEEWPALLLVTREPTDAVYSAEAIIGPYVGAVMHPGREALLLEAFDVVLHALGERPRFAVPGDDPITGTPANEQNDPLADPASHR